MAEQNSECNCHECTQARYRGSFQYQYDQALKQTPAEPSPEPEAAPSERGDAHHIMERIANTVNMSGASPEDWVWETLAVLEADNRLLPTEPQQASAPEDTFTHVETGIVIKKGDLLFEPLKEKLAEPQQASAEPSITQKMRGRRVTNEEAADSARRLINSHFRNRGREDRARCSIPARPEDDDLIITDYVREQAEREAQLAALKQSASKTEPEPILCDDCGVNPGDGEMILTKKQWLMVNPQDYGMLCTSCIVKRAHKLPGALSVYGHIVFTGDHDPGDSPERIIVPLRLENADYSRNNADLKHELAALKQSLGECVEALEMYRRRDNCKCPTCRNADAALANAKALLEGR
jgi:hypothetical protein